MSTALAVIFVFGLLVFFHELGHFSVAKLVGIRVYEFSIGFGPRLFGFRKGETRYSLRALPLGGFVRMAGMDEDEDLNEIKKQVAEDKSIRVQDISDEEAERLKARIDDSKSFKNKPIWQRMAVIFAGSFNNFILAFIVLFLVFYLIGVPAQIPVVNQVDKGTPAEQAGLKPGDRITAINGQQIKDWEQLSGLVSSSRGKSIVVEYRRDGRTQKVALTPILKDGRYLMGIYAKTQNEKQPFLKALNSSYTSFKAVFAQITHVLGSLFVDKNTVNNLSGPVGIVVGISKAAQMGTMTYMFFIAVISINLGIFNLLPIPALDGSRIMFLLIERLRGRPVDPNKENMVHLVGFALLLLLIVVITYRDIVRLPELGG